MPSPEINKVREYWDRRASAETQPTIEQMTPSRASRRGPVPSWGWRPEGRIEENGRRANPLGLSVRPRNGRMFSRVTAARM
jgi:hypothetical protein